MSESLPGSYHARDHSLLGTTVDVHTNGADPVADAEAVLAEMRRLESVFNIFDSTSDISRYKRGDAPSTELETLFEIARRWERVSGGAFSTTPNGGLDLNAIAKGWITDQAVASISGPVWVNAGGDIRHVGPDPIRVGIEDPAQPHDNSPPAAVVTLTNAAVATSGTARRGGHIVNPKTRQTATATPSLTVIAPNAATADVLATIGVVIGGTDALEFIEDQPDCAAMLILESGELLKSRSWCQRTGGG